MKDAKGHGSNKRGTTAAHQTGVSDIGPAWGSMVGVPAPVQAPANIALGSSERPGGWRDPHSKVPDVEWDSRDLQDASKRVDEETVRRDYVPKAEQKSVDVYRAYVPMEDIPNPKLVEVEDDDPEGYDWSEHGSRNSSPPPVKLEVGKSGKVEIVDGNHRLRYWQDHGYTHAPAYVIDHRPNVKHDDGDDE